MRTRKKKSRSICDVFHSDYRMIEPSREVDLFIVDPPYGGIVKDSYDCLSTDRTVVELNDLMFYMSKYAEIGTTCYLFGGIGTYRNRSLFRFLSEVEIHTNWRIHNMITWKKRRGYGTQYNYMFTREEIVMFVYDSKKPNYFKVQYTEEQRSEEWKKRLERKKYKPNSDKMRVSNVWFHINELFRNKRCTAEKPVDLYRTLIRASCPVGGFVFDPMCGSGTTLEAAMIERVNCECCEVDEEMFAIARDRLTKTRGK